MSNSDNNIGFNRYNNSVVPNAPIVAYLRSKYSFFDNLKFTIWYPKFKFTKRKTLCII